MQSPGATILRPASPESFIVDRAAAPAGTGARRTPDVAGLLVSATALGCALQVNFGQYHPLAIPLLTVALAGCVLGLTGGTSRPFEQSGRKKIGVVGVALALQFLLLLTRSPGATGLLAGTTGLGPFCLGVVAAGAITVGALGLSGWRARACVVAMMLVHAGLGVWVLRAAPDPGVDVVMFQRQSADALLHGSNPYSLTFPAPGGGADRFYAPGVVRDGRLLFGFPYPPLSLFLALPGHWLGDFRYAQLFAMTAAGGLVAFARPGRTAIAAAAFLLFTPRGFFVLEAGWTEPFAVLLLAATVFAASRPRAARMLPVALGLLVAVKQYLVLGLLMTPLLARPPRGGRGGWRLAATALAVAAAVSLPLALWDLPAFVHSVVLLQIRQPFRDDALSYLAAGYQLTGWRAPSWVVLLAVVPAAALCLRRCPRTPAGFAAATALVCFVFFAFGKQAFCNYYHFVIGALCCAAGAAAAARSETGRVHAPQRAPGTGPNRAEI